MPRRQCLSFFTSAERIAAVEQALQTAEKRREGDYRTADVRGSLACGYGEARAAASARASHAVTAIAEP
jgi:hypothetical protein